MSEELLERLKAQIKKTPGLTASNLAKKLSVTRKEVNSLLYRHNKKIFLRFDNGEKAPTWNLLDVENPANPNEILNENQTKINPAFQKVSKLIESIEIQLGATNEFEAKLGSIKFQVFLSDEGVNSKYTRFEIVEINHLIVVINTNSILSNQDLDSIGFHVLHCIADCVSSYKLTQISSSDSDHASIKNLILKNLLSLSFNFK